jgi:hypothetical protein
MIDAIGDRGTAISALSKMGREMRRGPSALNMARARLMSL